MGKDKKTTQTATATQQASGQQSFANQSFLDSLARAYQTFQNQTSQQTEQDTVQQQINNLISTLTGQTTGTQQQQQVTGVDAASQEYINRLREHALGAFSGFNAAAFAPTAAQINEITRELQNPFMADVVGSVRDNFDRLRAQSRTGTQQEATLANAYGGSRHGIAEAMRLAELDRAENAQIANMLASDFSRAQAAATPLAISAAQAPVQAILAQQQLLREGLGPTGTVTTGTGTTSQQTQQTSQAQQIADLISRITGSQTGMSSGSQTSQQTAQQTGTQTGTSQSDMITKSNAKQTTKQDGNLLGDLLGVGLTLASLFTGGGGGGGGLLPLGNNVPQPTISGGMLPGGEPWWGVI